MAENDQGEKNMKISEWLDKKEAKALMYLKSHCPIASLMNDEPDDTIFFKDMNHDGSFLPPIIRFYCRALWALVLLPGRDSVTGNHSPGIEWRLFTKDKDLALKTAKSHIE